MSGVPRRPRPSGSRTSGRLGWRRPTSPAAGFGHRDPPWFHRSWASISPTPALDRVDAGQLPDARRVAQRVPFSVGVGQFARGVRPAQPEQWRLGQVDVALVDQRLQGTGRATSAATCGCASRRRPRRPSARSWYRSLWMSKSSCTPVPSAGRSPRPPCWPRCGRCAPSRRSGSCRATAGSPGCAGCVRPWPSRLPSHPRR